MRRWETPSTCCHTQHDLCWVIQTSWLLHIPFWHEAHYIFLRTFRFFSLSSSSPIPQQRLMETQPPHPGGEGSKVSRWTGASSNMSLLGAQHERRHQLVYRNAANEATKNMPLDAHLNIVRKTRGSRKKQQHTIQWEYIHTMVNGRQLTVWCTAGECRELRDYCITPRNGKPPWSTMAVVRTVHKIKHHDVVGSGIIANETCHKHPRECTKQASITFEQATEAYIVEAIAKSHCSSSNWFLVGFQHVCYYGKARRSGTAGTVRHALRLEYDQNGQRRVFVRCDTGNAIYDQETLRWSPRRAEAGCWVSR